MEQNKEHNKISGLSWMQFIGSVFVIIIYLILAYMMAHWDQDFGLLQDGLSLMAVALNLPPFISAAACKSKWLATLIYLLCIWVCAMVICLFFAPVALGEWSVIAALVAFLSVFIVTAADSKVVQAKLDKLWRDTST